MPYDRPTSDCQHSKLVLRRLSAAAAIAALSTIVLGAHTDVVPTDLGTFGGVYSRAVQVNDRGDVIGWAETSDGGPHAFIWNATYGMTDIGTLGGPSSSPTGQFSIGGTRGVTALGQVVGISATSDGSTHAFSWTRGDGITDLGTLGGNYSFAADVNNNGQVVGGSTLANGNEHAFSWTSAGGLVDLGTLGGTYSYAYLVNEAGQVAGYSTTATGKFHVFSWTAAGGMVDVGTLGKDNVAAYAMNEAGEIVGYSTRTDGTNHAFSWSGATGIVDLGTTGGPSSSGFMVNDLGQIMGRSDFVPGQPRVFFKSGTAPMADIGTLGGAFTIPADIGLTYQHSMSRTGQIVGYSTTTDDLAAHAFSWTPSGGMIDLGTIGGTSSYANAVSNGGLVVGTAYTPGDAVSHAFVWVPGDDMFDLGTFGGDYSVPSGVSDAGLVVGWSNTDSAQHAAVWTLTNTAVGSSVAVQPVDATGAAPASLTFSTIDQPGETTLAMSNSGPAAPSGFLLGDPPLYYDLHTSAQFAGQIQVCLNYSGVSFNNGAPRLFHYENGAWIDVTTSVDAAHSEVCGAVASLSPFALLQPGIVVPTSKDQCKDDGWRQLQHADGSAFKNQGACVSYVATKKK